MTTNEFIDIKRKSREISADIDILETKLYRIEKSLVGQKVRWNRPVTGKDVPGVIKRIPCRGYVVVVSEIGGVEEDYYVPIYRLLLDSEG